jgi:transposase
MAPEKLMQKVSSLELEVAQLKSQLEWFKRHFFGTGKSESIDALQLRLNFMEVEKEAPETEAKTQHISYERKKAFVPRESRAEHFKDVPVMETVELIPEHVKADPEAWVRIGEEETFEIDITAPKLFKRRIIRPKFRNRFNRDMPPVLAPAPVRALSGGYASAGLLVWVTLSKYLDHLPLYRLERMSERWGAHLSRQAMSDWIEAVSQWFEPIYGLMRKDLLRGGYVQADETPVNFLDPELKKGKALQGYLWVIGKPGGNVVFDWRLSRRHEEATTLLEGFEGVLQSDGYGAYESFVKNHPKVARVACLAHIRRKFTEAIHEDPVAVNFVLRLIGKLYHWESQWDEKKLKGVEQRSALRLSHFGQPLSLLKKVLQALAKRVRPTSNLGNACNYMMGQWKDLLSHCHLGMTRIDNNLIENAIRPSAIGKKNFLFIGAPQAGKKTAVIYSIVVSCQRHGVDPFAYMKDLLERLPRMTNQDDLITLLPNKWKAQMGS